MTIGKCQLCKRTKQKLEKHHLAPYRPMSETIEVCGECGDTIHKLFTNDELVKRYDSLQKLRNSKKIKKYIVMIRKRK